MTENRDSELRAALEGALGAPVEALERRPYPYRSSFALEELELRLSGGERLQMLFKDVSPGALSERARAAKPAFLFDPLREIDSYLTVLGPRGVEVPRCYGAVVEPECGRYWLFLEKVDGVALWQVGELAVWQEVARRLATLHDRCRGARTDHLLRYDADFYRTWPRRAVAFRASPELAQLAAAYEPVVQRLLELPRTFVHGELYASNVIVAERPPQLAVYPVDWEMAALAPALVDLAALTTGAWSDDDRRTIARAYYDVLLHPGSLDEFFEALDFCRLHLAVQCLGWSNEWAPPMEHAHDWLGEALRLGKRIGLL